MRHKNSHNSRQAYNPDDSKQQFQASFRNIHDMFLSLCFIILLRGQDRNKDKPQYDAINHCLATASEMCYAGPHFTLNEIRILSFRTAFWLLKYSFTADILIIIIEHSKADLHGVNYG